MESSLTVELVELVYPEGSKMLAVILAGWFIWLYWYFALCNQEE